MKFNPLIDNNKKLLTLTDIGKALEEVAPQSIVFTALPQPKIDFVREVLANNTAKPDNIASIDDIIFMSEDLKSFRENLSKNMTLKNIKIVMVSLLHRKVMMFFYKNDQSKQS